jgi:hypothetical protein
LHDFDSRAGSGEQPEGDSEMLGLSGWPLSPKQEVLLGANQEIGNTPAGRHPRSTAGKKLEPVSASTQRDAAFEDGLSPW